MLMSVLPRPIALALALVMLGEPIGALAQVPLDAPLTEDEAEAEAPASFVINLRATDIQVFAEQVANITGRTLILDPGVQGQVTVISSARLDEDAVWQLFQSVLRVNGLAAVPAGDSWRIVAEARAPELGAPVDRLGLGDSTDFVTRLIPLDSLDALEAQRVLRPLVAEAGYLEALEAPNAIIVSDAAENVRRIEQLVLALDQGEGAATGTLRLDHARARDVAAVVAEVAGLGGAAAEGEGFGRLGPRLAVDERSNTLVFRADPETITLIRQLAAALDRPGAAEPETRVFRLRYADAEDLTRILRGLGGAPTPVDNPVATSLAAAASGGALRGVPFQPALGDEAGKGGLPPAAGGAAAPAALQRVSPFGGDPGARGPGAVGGAAATTGGTAVFAGGVVAIEPAPLLNAIVVRGPATAIQEIAALIEQLDVRRPQVMIEAAIVEITGGEAEQLGIQLGFDDAGFESGLAATSLTTSGPSLARVLDILDVPAAALLGPGLNIAIGQGDGYGILIQALAQSSRANLLSTPSLTTLDNQPAEIVVGQNVPFRTGSFTGDGTGRDPFTTIERQDVGITLRVVPRVHEGDVVRLEVAQEVSSLVPGSVAGAADLVTNRRSIQTTVLADNGQTIVLGGLITDDRSETESQVPVLGDIPIAGALFSSDRVEETRRTLFVFLRPTILRDRGAAGAAAAGQRDSLEAAAGTLDLTPSTARGLGLEGVFAPPRLEIEGIY